MTWLSLGVAPHDCLDGAYEALKGPLGITHIYPGGLWRCDAPGCGRTFELTDAFSQGHPALDPDRWKEVTDDVDL